MKSTLQQDATEILHTEQLIARARRGGMVGSGDLLAHLERMTAIARRLHLERADPNAPSENCSRCAYIEREYGAEAVG
jgi:hypothetical protein